MVVTRPPGALVRSVGTTRRLKGTKLLGRLRALVLLGGSVRPIPFAVATGRSLLDLPISPEQTVLDNWYDQAREFAGALGLSTLPVRVLIDRRVPEHSLPSGNGRVELRIERDPLEYRGTAGVLFDLCQRYDDEDYVLVASAAQILLEPLEELVWALAVKDADVSLVAHADGTPSGLILVRCGSLRSVSKVGYVDLKEMALPQIAKAHRVRVVQRNHPSGLPVRTPRDYVKALRKYYLLLDGHGIADDPFEENWQSKFHIVEEGASVDPDVRMCDSVVLRGARIEDESVLVRSVLCSTGVVRRGTTVVDCMIS